MAEKATAASFEAIKLLPFDEIPNGLTDKGQIEQFLTRGITCGAAVRDMIGPKRDLRIDVHSRCSLEDGLNLAKRFEPLKLDWLEEVTPAKPIENLAQINKAAKMPKAGDESLIVRGSASS